MHNPDAIAKDARTFRKAVKQGLPYKPLYVKLKIVWNCNLRCGMCLHWREHREAPLKFDFYHSLIDELADLGSQKIHITGGEPTLHPDLEAIIAHINQKGMRPTMTTNATRIDSDRAYRLTQAGLRKVNISIDSPDPMIHNQIRGVAGAWEKTVAGFRFLRPWLKKGRMQINTVVNQLNYASLIHLPEFATSLGCDRINLIPMDEHTPDLQRLTREQILDYNARIAPKISEEGLARGLIKDSSLAYPFGVTEAEFDQTINGKYGQNYYDHHPCYAPWTHALIDQVGRVKVCCMMPNQPVLGDLRVSSFTEIWTGKAFSALRDRTKRPLFETCRQCDMFVENNRQLDAIANGGIQTFLESLCNGRRG